MGGRLIALAPGRVPLLCQQWLCTHPLLTEQWHTAKISEMPPLRGFVPLHLFSFSTIDVSTFRRFLARFPT
jgi:hypothetical protein